ncbi:MAG TPA: AraC family transcriptional regulator [Planctomycetota bacterium]|jgi:AraC-like DNA-binding protein
MDPQKLQAEFMSQLGDHLYLKDLFESLPDVYLFVKNRKGQFILGNQLLIRKCNAQRWEDVAGKTDFDFFPKELCENFLRDDTQIMETGQPIINKVELVAADDGSIHWHCTTKLPIRGKDGSIIGVAGATRDLRKASASFMPYEQMAKVIEYIQAHFCEAIEPKQLAEIAHLSVSQLERKFRRLFHVSPTQYVTRVRVNAACRELEHTNKKIAAIARELGFYDHSYFTKRFSEFMGMSPADYRRKHVYGE